MHAVAHQRGLVTRRAVVRGVRQPICVQVMRVQHPQRARLGVHARRKLRLRAVQVLRNRRRAAIFADLQRHADEVEQHHAVPAFYDRRKFRIRRPPANARNTIQFSLLQRQNARHHLGQAGGVELLVRVLFV